MRFSTVEGQCLVLGSDRTALSAPIHCICALIDQKTRLHHGLCYSFAFNFDFVVPFENFSSASSTFGFIRIGGKGLLNCVLALVAEQFF